MRHSRQQARQLGGVGRLSIRQNRIFDETSPVRSISLMSREAGHGPGNWCLCRNHIADCQEDFAFGVGYVAAFKFGCRIRAVIDPDNPRMGDQGDFLTFG